MVLDHFFLLQLATLRAPEFNNMPAEGFTVEDRTAVQYHDPRQNNSAFFHNLMLDYDMGSHLLALRYSESQSHVMGILDRDYPGAYAYGYPQEVRTLTEIDTIEARISNQDSDKLEYTFGLFSRDSQTFTTYDLDRSYVVTEIFPAIMNQSWDLMLRLLSMHVMRPRLTQQFMLTILLSYIVL